MDENEWHVCVRTFQEPVVVPVSYEQVKDIAKTLQYDDVDILRFLAIRSSEMVMSRCYQEACDRLVQLRVIESVEGMKKFYQLTLLGWVVVDHVIAFGFREYVSNNQRDSSVLSTQ